MITSSVLEDVLEEHPNLFKECKSVPITEESYPANLLSDVLDIVEGMARVQGEQIELHSIWDYDMRAFLGLVSKLPEKEQRIIDRRYRYGDTLRSIGDDMGITRQRVEEIKNCILKKLGQAISNIEIVSKSEFLNVLRENESLKEIIKNTEFIQPPAPVPVCRMEDDPYNESIGVLDLSTRPYNCLFKKGIRTIRDIINFDQQDGKWYNIRNLGAGSMEEISRKMKLICGYTLQGRFVYYK